MTLIELQARVSRLLEDVGDTLEALNELDDQAWGFLDGKSVDGLIKAQGHLQDAEQRLGWVTSNV